jgi:hypothetical protein
MPILQVRVAIWAYSPAAHTVRYANFPWVWGLYPQMDISGTGSNLHQPKLGSNRLSFSEVQCCPTPSMVWLPGCHQNHVPYSNWNKFRYHPILAKFSTILKTIISHDQPFLTIIYPKKKLPPYCPQRACPLAAQHASWGRRGDVNFSCLPWLHATILYAWIYQPGGFIIHHNSMYIYIL